ncbi:MAG: T9SS type A sorting domain-containing protein [Saprospiraceae bacterium]|nr:T9SS type A sorting domain-containing protein [Saprospiraceae bacterium]
MIIFTKYQVKVLFVMFYFLTSFEMGAQNNPLFSIDSIGQNIINADLSNGFEMFNLELFFENRSNDTLQLKWRREFDENCPDQWYITSADPLISYPPSINESVLVITMLPGDSNFIIQQSYVPNFLPGCCDSKIIFFDANNPSNILDTAYFHIGVNSGDCTTTKVAEIENAAGTIFPNPTTGIIQLKDWEAIEQIQIFDCTGRLVYDKQQPKNNVLSVEGLLPNVYCVKIQMKDSNWKVEKLIVQ